MSEQRQHDPSERGALWEKSGRKGTYFTGMIDGQPCVVFRNDRKREGSNAPDWRVLKPQKREDREPDQAVPPGQHAEDEDIEF